MVKPVSALIWDGYLNPDALKLATTKKITLFYTASNLKVSINVSVYSLVCFIIYKVYFESVIRH